MSPEVQGVHARARGGKRELFIIEERMRTPASRQLLRGRGPATADGHTVCSCVLLTLRNFGFNTPLLFPPRFFQDSPPYHHWMGKTTALRVLIHATDVATY